MMNTKRSTIGLLLTLSALLIVFAVITKNVLEMSFPKEGGINATITVSGLEADEVQP